MVGGLIRIVRGAIGHARRIAADRKGVAAVEFAFLMPVMIIMYVGVVDVTRGVIASRKLDVLSRTISDLVSQQPTSQTTSISTLSTIFTAASAVMQPYNTAGITLTVSAVDIKAKSNNTCCDALVRWSYTQGGTLRACTTPLTQVPNGTVPTPTNIPVALITANQTAGYGYTSGLTSYVIVADVAYTYKPIFFQAISWFSAGMHKTTYMVPRSASGPVTIANPSGAPVGQSGVICFS